MKAPSAIYVWLVPSEDVLEQPGSWRIRKWDTEPFPEANYTLQHTGTLGAAPKPCEPHGVIACLTCHEARLALYEAADDLGFLGDKR